MSDQRSILGITGGVATGKSAFARLLAERLPGARTFSADACVSNLLDGDPHVLQQIREVFGPQALTPEGKADRAWIRKTIFRAEARRKALEILVHPRVREELQREVDVCRREYRVLVAEIPLLFEAGFAEIFDRILTVACSEGVQRKRAAMRPGMSPSLTKKMIASQWPLGEKMLRSHHVVWNDGSWGALSAQADFLSTLFHVRNGPSTAS